MSLRESRFNARGRSFSVFASITSRRCELISKYNSVARRERGSKELDVITGRRRAHVERN
jgi:hypothetical protein